TIAVFDAKQRLLSNINKNFNRITEISSPEVIKSKADSYLNQNKARFGIENFSTDIRMERISKSPAGSHLIYQEIVEGIPVYDARIVVSVNNKNEVSFVTGNFRSGLTLRYKQPRIQSLQAIELARAYLNVSGELRGDQKTELMVFDSKDKGPLLTYRVEIPCSSPFGDWEVFVDAVNGDIVHVKNLIIFKSGTDGTGMIWAPEPLTMAGVYYGGDYVDNGDQDHDSLNAQRISVTLKDLYTDDNDDYVLEGPYVKLTDRDSPSDKFPHLSDPDSFVYTRQDQEFEAVMVYYHIDASYRRLLELGFFENDTVEEGLLEFEADPHGYNGLDNSYYSPMGNYCAFGEGGVDDAEDAAVIWHEYAHALQYNISEVSYDPEGETFSLLEGCSDYWAASYKRRINSFGWNHVFLWDAGIKSAEGDTTFWKGRRCDLDWRYSKEDSAQYAGTHAWGQIWSSALMRIWTVLGPDITDKLFITSHKYWGMHPDFEMAAQAFIQADLDINGGINLPVISQWFDFHGLIDLREYQPQITHDPISDVELIDDHYVINCRIVPSKSKASLDTTNLWLIWSLDSSFTDSSLLTAGMGEHVFTTEIPDVTEPSPVNYYFYARDSLDLFSTDPFDAPQNYYSFYAGPDSLPPPPLNLEITDSIDVIDLTWQEVITGKYVSYNIFKSEDGVNFSIADSTPSSSYTDTTVFLGGRYYYYVTTVFNQWESNPSDTVDALVDAIISVVKDDKLPSTYQLKQNFPNPFNPRTEIGYDLPERSDVTLEVYNMLGQKIKTLVNEPQSEGYYQIIWDGRTDTGNLVGSGVYFYRIQANNFSKVRKMILVR
ncbi:MAG: T9SS type A sorting domain-containing protein, partial [Calditrichia bacterium]|nr:T9SS type A sorting domain-containing protein [Calditrichia bacterium]